MTPLDQLNAWLEKPVYEAGVVLYQQLIGPGFLLSMLKTGPDDFNRRKLIDALTEKRDALAAEQQARAEAYPEPLVQSLEEAKNQMDQRTIIKERCRLIVNTGVTESEELKDYAFGILDIVDQLGAVYGRRDFFDQHGYMPDVVSVDAELTPAQLKQRQLSLRTYVIRYTKKLTGATDQKKEKNYTRLLEKYRSELAQVDQQLAALNNTTNGTTHFD